MSYYRKLVTGALLLLLCACSGANSGDVAGTMQAEQSLFVQESTAIAQTLRARSTQVASTAAAAQTYAANVEGLNRQLAATRSALIPPTQQLVERSGPVTPGMIATAGEALTSGVSTPPPSQNGSATAAPNQFTEVATAAGVRESDGCANGTQSQFTTNAPEIYLTARVLNVTAGSVIGSSWTYEGQVVFTSGSFTVPEDDSDYCVYYYIEPSDVAFSPGTWSAQFLLNGSPVGSAATFSIS